MGLKGTMGRYFVWACEKEVTRQAVQEAMTKTTVFQKVQVMRRIKVLKNEEKECTNRLLRAFHDFWFRRIHFTV